MMIRKVSIFFSILLLLSSVLYLQNIKVIKNPKPTHFEKKFVPLTRVKTISCDLDEGNFIGKIQSAVIDKNSNLYIYDQIQIEILKLDKNFKFIKAFGKKGKGPGEFGTPRGFGIELNIGPDNKLYVSDRFNKKIHEFDLNGNFIKDHTIKYTGYFLPVINTSGDFILPSTNNESILSVYSNKMELRKELLKRSNLNRFLFVKPGHLALRSLIFPRYKLNLHYLLLTGNRLLIISSNDMTYFLFKDLRLQKRITILPELALKVYKRDYLKDSMNEEDSFMPFILDCFLDSDDPNHFYIQLPKDMIKNRNVLYKFSINGILKKVLYIKNSKKNDFFHFLLKKNGVFYVNDSENIYLYKEG